LSNRLKAEGSFSFTIQQKLQFKTKLKIEQIQLILYGWVEMNDVTKLSVTSKKTVIAKEKRPKQSFY